MLLLMTKMDLLLSMTSAEDIRLHTLPLLYRALESDLQQIQELCLSVVPTCAPLLTSSTIKNALLPRLKRLCVSTSSLGVRVGSLVCVGKLLPHLDRWLITDEVLPLLKEVPCKDAAVIVAVSAVIRTAVDHPKLGVPTDIIATEVSVQNIIDSTKTSTLYETAQVY